MADDNTNTSATTFTSGSNTLNQTAVMDTTPYHLSPSDNPGAYHIGSSHQ